jgi:RNA polymerase sigma-70 factor, ECF subfamily
MSETPSFESVVEEHGAAIARLARGYEADADQQRDLVQEILVAIWRALPSFEGRSAVRTWVFRVAHNVAVTHVRAAATAGRLVGAGELEAHADARRDLEARADAARLAELVRALVPRERQIILLSLEGFGAQEIAEVTGLSADHVSVKVHRIKAALRAALTKGEAHGG